MSCKVRSKRKGLKEMHRNELHHKDGSALKFDRHA